jgi:hypothetical protein
VLYAFQKAKINNAHLAAKAVTYQKMTVFLDQILLCAFKLKLKNRSLCMLKNQKFARVLKCVTNFAQI